jgi:hypothetical protein
MNAAEADLTEIPDDSERQAMMEMLGVEEVSRGIGNRFRLKHLGILTRNRCKTTVILF